MDSKSYFDLSSGYKIPVVGLGTSKCKVEELEQALNAALEIGYRHIDTASVYNNENTIGTVLKQWLDSGKVKREQLFVATKLAFFNHSLNGIEENVLRSLEKLKLDYVDLYLIHFPVNIEKKEGHGEVWKTLETDHIAMWKDLEEQVDKGRIKSLGVSNFNQKQIQKILDSNPKHKITNLQVELHVFLQQPELVEFCHKNNITITAFGPLGSPGYNEHLLKVGEKAINIPHILSNEIVRKISEKHSKTPAQVVLRFLLQNDVIVIPKSVKPERLRENFDLFGFVLEESDMMELRRLDMGEKGRIFNFSMIKGLSSHPEWPFGTDIYTI
ncbi:unnamed protein product [Brassicogethes aeneus]|uniref:NADP-dependent oxidoreductase domain-containing protein n=1 Tax=Brassicogethes aeneus TaxID=1431903 RepID=A0A9P0B5R9_BRAAE|nr:unnamed protein product [Brassicogethes aeneus]